MLEIIQNKKMLKLNSKQNRGIKHEKVCKNNKTLTKTDVFFGISEKQEKSG